MPLLFPLSPFLFFSAVHPSLHNNRDNAGVIFTLTPRNAANNIKFPTSDAKTYFRRCRQKEGKKKTLVRKIVSAVMSIAFPSKNPNFICDAMASDRSLIQLLIILLDRLFLTIVHRYERKLENHIRFFFNREMCACVHIYTYIYAVNGHHCSPYCTVRPARFE